MCAPPTLVNVSRDRGRVTPPTVRFRLRGLRLPCPRRSSCLPPPPPSIIDVFLGSQGDSTDHHPLPIRVVPQTPAIHAVRHRRRRAPAAGRDRPHLSSHRGLRWSFTFLGFCGRVSSTSTATITTTTATAATSTTTAITTITPASRGDRSGGSTARSAPRSSHPSCPRPVRRCLPRDVLLLRGR